MRGWPRSSRGRDADDGTEPARDDCRHDFPGAHDRESLAGSLRWPEALAGGDETCRAAETDAEQTHAAHGAQGAPRLIRRVRRKTCAYRRTCDPWRRPTRL